MNLDRDEHVHFYSVDRQVLEPALSSSTPDFEDAVQAASATAQGLDALVTRDKGFKTELIPVLSVEDVLRQIVEDK